MAGTGQNGYSGDGGSATAATISDSYGVWGDITGVIYFADTSNHRIRKVSSSGIITTVAGTNSSGYSGDGGPASAAFLSSPAGIWGDSNANLYISETNNHCVRRVETGTLIISTLIGTGISGFTAGYVLAKFFFSELTYLCLGRC